MPSNKSQTLASPPVPTMPDPTDQTQRTSNGLMRTFMLRLTGSLQSLFGPAGGQYIDNPNALFFNTASQTFAAITTAYPVVFNATYLHNLVQLQSGSTSRIQVDTPGVYNFQYTGQVYSTNSSAKDIDLWIRRNNIDIGYSTRTRTVASNSQSSPLTWSFNIDMQAGDYIELMAAVTDINLSLRAAPASAPHPGVPSSVMTVNYMSALPDPLPTPP